MVSLTRLSLRPSSFDPAAFRAAVEGAKRRGEIRGGSEAAAVDKKIGNTATRLGGVESRWIDVTPALARQWLQNNFGNRRMDDDTVAAYARDMVNGVWVPTHQGIAFNNRDELIDGQHRLAAIIRAGVTVRLMVTFGLPADIDGREMTTMDAVDRGRTRSVADQLRIQHGIKDGSVIAAITASLGSICYGARTRRLSVGQTLDIYRVFQEPVDYVIIHRPREHGLRSVGVLAAFAFALRTEEGFFGGATPIAVMFDQLTTGCDLDPKAPLSLLRAFLRSDEAKLLSRSTDRGLAELTLQTIYLQARGSRPRKLEMATDGVEHFRSLQQRQVDQIAAIFRLPDPTK